MQRVRSLASYQDRLQIPHEFCHITGSSPVRLTFLSQVDTTTVDSRTGGVWAQGVAVPNLEGRRGL
jgi:hypothetical protein